MLSFLDYTVKLVFLCRQKKYKKMDDSLWFVEGRIRLRHIHKIDFCQEKKFSVDAERSFGCSLLHRE